MKEQGYRTASFIARKICDLCLSDFREAISKAFGELTNRLIGLIPAIISSVAIAARLCSLYGS
jgi:hypothetical protein